MKRTLLLMLVLALALGVAPLAAQTQSSVATCLPHSVAAPAFLAPAANAQSPQPAALPTNPLKGAIFLSDPDCESACYDDYLQCAQGCAACDQCSCQLAYCRVNCGVPFTGC